MHPSDDSPAHILHSLRQSVRPPVSDMGGCLSTWEKGMKLQCSPTSDGIPGHPKWLWCRLTSGLLGVQKSIVLGNSSAKTNTLIQMCKNVSPGLFNMGIREQSHCSGYIWKSDLRVRDLLWSPRVIRDRKLLCLCLHLSDIIKIQFKCNSLWQTWNTNRDENKRGKKKLFLWQKCFLKLIIRLPLFSFHCVAAHKD